MIRPFPARDSWPASVLLLVLLASALRAQQLPPQVDASPAVLVPTADPVVRQVPGVDGSPSPAAEYTATAASEMESVLRRLDVLEQNAAKPAPDKDKDKKPADGWTDLSGEKWTVRLGGHVQMD